MKQVESYTPRMPAEQWAVIKDFVRAAALEVTPHGPYPTTRFVHTIARHVHWCWQTPGLPLDRSIIFHRDVIEEFARVGCPDFTRTTAGNFRSTLLRTAEVLLPMQQRVTRLSPLCNPMPKSPYSTAEQAQLASWANSQASARRRRDAHTILALGLGAGLAAGELKHVQVGDLTVDDQGVLVRVTHGRPRIVPVLAEWEAPLRHLVDHAPPECYAFGVERTAPNSRNGVSNFVARTRGDVGLRPNSHRMRATWIVGHLTWGTPLVPFMEAAGLQTLEVIDRYMQFVPGVHSVDQARALVRHRVNTAPDLKA